MEDLKITDSFDDFIHVSIDNTGVVISINNKCCVILDDKQTNQLITHLSEQLTKIGVQVDILKDK